MPLNINTVHAHPDGSFIVNLGKASEVKIDLLPDAEGDNAATLFDWLRNNKAQSWQYSLDDLKAQALAEAHASALAVRQQIAGVANTERAVGWVLKALFAGVWQINDQAPNPLLNPLADVAAQGFAIETELTGEDATAIRDRSVEKAGAFFLALQLVEGMERVAESQIEAAETPVALELTITQLRALEAQALTKLAALTKGGS